METSTSLVLLMLAGLTVAIDIQFKYCKNGPQNLKRVNISPCDKLPCVFHHGVNVTVKVDFVSPTSSATLDAEIFGILAGIPIKFNMPNPNGCNDCGITCPIKQNMEYVYSSEFFVMKSYPNIQLVVQWDLRGANKDFLFCFEFPMTIVD
ncbi:Niemann-Pick C2 protein [Mytilus galloprovincialis]|uniref:Niemann-Pick C2 protein n=1 Tax=Mytilus galloprovincialis TaxID=29158 RepID=A0A8B6CNZ5_MYTGA|nr:Niemann-Pick C2 protein [Mytilus galloprovincialis]